MISREISKCARLWKNAAQRDISDEFLENLQEAVSGLSVADAREKAYGMAEEEFGPAWADHFQESIDEVIDEECSSSEGESPIDNSYDFIKSIAKPTLNSYYNDGYVFSEFKHGYVDYDFKERLTEFGFQPDANAERLAEKMLPMVKKGRTEGFAKGEAMVIMGMNGGLFYLVHQE